MTSNQVVALVDLIYDYLVGLENGRLTPFLTDWLLHPYITRSIAPATLPVLTCLPKIDTYGKAGEIVKRLKAIAQRLHWGQTYVTADFGAAFLEKYGWTELIGQRGPIASDQIACGFLLLGPYIEYPQHSHEAEEIYIPLSAPSWWEQGNKDWVLRPGNVPIYHQSWLPHSMRTKGVPLLALYLWHNGDLTQKSRIF